MGNPAPPVGDDFYASLFESGFDNNQLLHVQLTERLRGLITSGRLPVGLTLPAERRLGELVGVSRITVQQSYNALRREGLLSSHGRRGSIVSCPEGRISSPMNRLRGFTEEMTELGRVPSSRIALREVVRNAKVAAIFGLPSDARLLHLRRVRYADEQPVSNESAWYNLNSVPGLEQADLSGSVYALLEGQGQPLTHCEQVIEAVMPTPEDCEVFGLASPVPCVLIRRRSFTRANVMLEYVEGTFRGDVYSYRMTLSV